MNDPARLPAKTLALAELGRRMSLSLATIDPADPHQPHCSLAAFSLVDAGPGPAALAIHVSDLSAHSAHLRANPKAGALIAQGDEREKSLSMHRAMLKAHVLWPEPGSQLWCACERAHLSKHPQAGTTLGLPRFSFALLKIKSLRHIQGFGAARDVDMDELAMAFKA